MRSTTLFYENKKKGASILLLIQLSSLKAKAGVFLVIVIIFIIVMGIILWKLYTSAKKAVEDGPRTTNQTLVAQRYYGWFGEVNTDIIYDSDNDYFGASKDTGDEEEPTKFVGPEESIVPGFTFQYMINDRNNQAGIMSFGGSAEETSQMTDLVQDGESYRFLIKGYGQILEVDSTAPWYVRMVEQDTNTYPVVIERSIDTIHWTPIHTNSEYLLYTREMFTDTNSPPGQAFYRIVRRVH